MNINRFKQIIEYSSINKKYMKYKIEDFYVCAEMGNNREFLNLIQIVRPLFEKKNYIIIELPFADKEIGALCYKKDFMGYVFLNTSLPKINTKFALCHEIYHVFYQETEFKQKVELLNEHYYEYEEEFAANLFASMLLMPEQNYKLMYNKFQNESKEGESSLSILVKLMSYFEVPYMAVLIRCYELGLLDSGKVLEELINIDTESIKSEFKRLWLDESILKSTKKDDYNKFEMLVKLIGEDYAGEYIDEKSVNKAIQNMRLLYDKIKGE